MKKEYCVYVHTNKTNGKRYVGITRRKPTERWRGGSSYKYNSHFYRSIKKYGWDGFEHDVLMTGLTKEQADRWEQTLIAQWDTTNPKKGYNISLGGGGSESISDSTRKKMSMLAKRRFENPDEVKKNRERGLLQFSTIDAIEKDRIAQLEFHKKNPEARYRQAKPVNQYDMNGRFIRQWKSISDAMHEFGRIGIGAACKSTYGRKTAGGYMWRFSDDVSGTDDIQAVVIDDGFRAINQYDLDGVFIRKWRGISEAEEEMNIRNLSEVCNGNRGKAAGFMWRFADLENRKQIEPYADSRFRGVSQFDKHGNYIRSYKSIKEAGVSTGISKTGIVGVCGGKNKTAGGYIWRYSDEIQNEAI